jgi:hypothetical protein
VNTSTTPAKRSLLFAALACAGASLLAFRTVDGVGFLGFDAYPSITASRIASWSDFVGTFQERLMHYWFPQGDFYRPVTNLSIALDYRLWELEPAGYHATNTALLGFTGWCLFWLARRLAPGARFAAVIALAFYLIHPLQLEVYPVLARRADMLCGAFVALALVASTRRHDKVRTASTFALVALAVASKVTGILVVPLAFLIARGAPMSTTKAARATLPHFAAALIVFGARLTVLGGIGGYDHAGRHQRWAVPWKILVSLFNPPASVGGVLSMICIAAGFLTLLALALHGRRQHNVHRGRTDVLSLLLVGASWLALSLLLLLSTDGRLGWWYSFMPLLGLSLMVGAVGARLLEVIEQPTSTRRRLFAALGSASMLVGCLVLAANSPLIRAHPRLYAGSTEQREFLSEVSERLSQPNASGHVTAPRLPTMVPSRSGRESALGLLAPYSVQAWADLLFPDEGVQVLFLMRGKGPIAQGRPPTPKKLELIIVRALQGSRGVGP